MANETKIAWTDLSWNVATGCSKVSAGCAHCYAETLSLRYGQTTKPWTPANAAENVLLKPHKLREPLSGAKAWRGLGAAAKAAGKTYGKLVFVNSMSDLFHEQIPDEFIAQVFGIMALAPQHTFQILTKRPERMRDLMIAWKDWRQGAYSETSAMPLPNVWLGVSIENRRFVGRADVLRDTPAAVRFISAEPLLGPIAHTLNLDGIDWVIVGGESGPGHRRMDLAWARDLRDACETEGVTLFVKQLGGARSGTRLEDLPADLRVREFPTARVRA